MHTLNYEKDFRHWEDVRDSLIQKTFPPVLHDILLLTDPSSILEQENDIGSYIFGGAGVGKTVYAAKILLNEMRYVYGVTNYAFNNDIEIKENTECLFVSFPELIQKLKATFSPKSDKTELDVLRPYLDCHCLLIDEFNLIGKTDWIYQTVYYLINHRYSQMSKTIITCNEGVDSVVDGDLRLIRRIESMCKMIDKEPWNKKKKKYD